MFKHELEKYVACNFSYLFKNKGLSRSQPVTYSSDGMGGQRGMLPGWHCAGSGISRGDKRLKHTCKGQNADGIAIAYTVVVLICYMANRYIGLDTY